MLSRLQQPLAAPGSDDRVRIGQITNCCGLHFGVT